jgi:hypothetical protein
MTAASLAPAGSLCAVHPTATAATICARCGSFMCAECSRNNQENLCPKCRETSGFDVQVLARAYKSLVSWFGVQLLIEIFSSSVPPGPLKGLVSLALLASIVPLTIFAYRTAKALGSSLAAVWAVAMFVPCVNVITLLVLSSRATSACRQRNIPVGFFGPKI